MHALRQRLSPAAIAFLLPNFLGFCLFTLVPVVASFGLAFTNWSLKPAVPLEFLGGRNFVDLLWVRPLGAGDSALCALYLAGVGLLVGSAALAAWALLVRWRGLRTGAALWATLAFLVAAGAAYRHAHHSLYIAAALLLAVAFVGRAAAGEEGFAVGLALLPPLGFAVAVGLLGALHGPMWAAYEPNDARFWLYLYNTVYLMLALPFSVAGSLALALLLNERLPLASGSRYAAVGLCGLGGVISSVALWALGWRDAAVLGAVLWGLAALGAAFNVVAFRTVFYLPSFTSGVALMILWKALYNPQTGPINIALGTLTGLSSTALPQWLASIEWAKPALMIMGVWTGIGGTSMLLYLAALSNVPPDLLEAAAIDGASPWQRFVHILWPQVLPTTFFIGITSVVGGLQGGFEQARVMTGGGPAGATTTLSYYIYSLGFEDLNFGYASALSWVLFAVLFVVTAFNWRFGKDLEN